jgi:hypothetical protein
LWGPMGLMMLFSFLAAGSLPRGKILELAKRVQFLAMNSPEFVADFLKRCDAVPGTRVLLSIGNPRNDCLGIGTVVEILRQNTGTTVVPAGSFRYIIAEFYGISPGK